ELRFGVPEVPSARLVFVAAGPPRQLQAVGRVGSQKLSAEKNPATLEADIGGVKAVQVRWRQGAAGTAVGEGRGGGGGDGSGCVWDVSESGADLTACYRVRVEQGAVSVLRFDLPADLEPTRVAVRPLDGPVGSASGLRDWSLGAEQGGTRQLRIDLSGPTEGQ